MMSKTQNALERNIKSLTTKRKSEPVKYTKSKDAKLFPYATFPYRLEDRKDNKVCWFECLEHAIKYIERYKLQPIKEYKLQAHVSSHNMG